MRTSGCTTEFFTPPVTVFCKELIVKRDLARQPVVEKLGGKFTHSWFAFGDYDIVAIVEMPDNVEAAAFSLAAAAGGAVRSIKTTPLLTKAEGVEAMRKAAKSGYKAPARAARA